MLLFRFLVVLEVLQGASGLKICQIAKLLNLFREQPPSLVLNVDLAADLDLDLAAGLKEAQPCPTAHILSWAPARRQRPITRTQSSPHLREVFLPGVFSVR